MKKISIISMIFVLGVFVTFNACKKDNFTEEDAIKLINTNDRAQDSLQHLMEKEILNLNATIAQTRANYENALLHGDMELANTLQQNIMNLQSEIDMAEAILAAELVAQQALMNDSIANASYFSVEVIDASVDFNNKSAKSVEGVNVTVSAGGKLLTVTTDATGIAYFENLRKGAVAVKVEKAGYTTVTCIGASTAGYSSIKVPVLSLDVATMATVTGKVTVESDLTNRSKENAPNGTQVLFKPNFAGYVAGVVNFAISGYTNVATTTDGVYTITLPADRQGKFGYNISVPDFELNQTLLASKINGTDVTGAGNLVQTVPAKFGTSIANTTVPATSPIYAVISAPVVNNSATFLTKMYNANGVRSVNVTNSGFGYDGSDAFKIRIYNADKSDFAQFNPIIDDATGRVLSVNVEQEGSGITATTAALPATEVSIEGTLLAAGGVVYGASFNAANQKKVFFNKDTRFTAVVALATGSTGKNLKVSGITTAWGWNEDQTYYGRYVTGITVDDGGENYNTGTAVPHVDDAITIKIAAVNTVCALGLNKTSSQIQAVEVTNPGTGYAPNTTIDVEFSSGIATGKAYTDAEGRIYKVADLTDVANYTDTPNVLLAVDYKQAKVVVPVNAEGLVQDIAGADITEQGDGYVKSTTTVKFYNQATGVEITDIDYTLSVAGGKITGITIDDAGAGIYNDNDDFQAADGEESRMADPGVKILKDFYLGTGKRDSKVQ